MGSVHGLPKETGDEPSPRVEGLVREAVHTRGAACRTKNKLSQSAPTRGGGPELAQGGTSDHVVREKWEAAGGSRGAVAHMPARLSHNTCSKGADEDTHSPEGLRVPETVLKRRKSSRPSRNWGASGGRVAPGPRPAGCMRATERWRDSASQRECQ